MESKHIFIDDPNEALKCCICLEVAIDPRQEEGCGKLFCKSCVEEWDEDTCPTCRIEARYFSDKKSKQRF